MLPRWAHFSAPFQLKVGPFLTAEYNRSRRKLEYGFDQDFLFPTETIGHVEAAI